MGFSHNIQGLYRFRQRAVSTVLKSLPCVIFFPPHFFTQFPVSADFEQFRLFGIIKSFKVLRFSDDFRSLTLNYKSAINFIGKLCCLEFEKFYDCKFREILPAYQLTFVHCKAFKRCLLQVNCTSEGKLKADRRTASSAP